MTPVELNLVLLIGTLCGVIQDTSPLASHATYNKNDDVALAIEISCIKSKTRDRYIQPDKGYTTYECY